MLKIGLIKDEVLVQDPGEALLTTQNAVLETHCTFSLYTVTYMLRYRGHSEHFQLFAVHSFYLLLIHCWRGMRDNSNKVHISFTLALHSCTYKSCHLRALVSIVVSSVSRVCSVCSVCSISSISSIVSVVSEVLHQLE